MTSTKHFLENIDLFIFLFLMKTNRQKQTLCQMSREETIEVFFSIGNIIIESISLFVTFSLILLRFDLGNVGDIEYNYFITS